MNILIALDMEGIIGVTCRDGIWDESTKDYLDACKYMTMEVNIAVEACKEAGSDKIYISDGHASNNNLLKMNCIRTLY